ncbi:hypothetical protein OBBRIDRAFT_152595 [Obba rivulosa]|uniref:Uncharacterized protein n=1 Tax=Obba rivulosa TaxID=1052685 RepID=A0A8E2DM37_9APHY|nr:hypothetical protein OBBRIDRAFT_152595 [Obba rivulosa]
MPVYVSCQASTTSRVRVPYNPGRVIRALCILYLTIPIVAATRFPRRRFVEMQIHAPVVFMHVYTTHYSLWIHTLSSLSPVVACHTHSSHDATAGRTEHRRTRAAPMQCR